MLFNSRLWAPALLVGMLLCSSGVRADAEEDYQTGFKSYRGGDFVGAIKPLRKAVAAGHVKSMVLLAYILDYSEFDEEAAEMYRKAADLGESEGMLGLGAMMSVGEGIKKDPLEARRWILKAAELGNVSAIKVMAQAYLRGELGFTEADRRSTDALQWVVLAAKNDHLPAVDALALAYRTGDLLAVSPDPAMVERYVAQANKLREIEPGKKKKKKAAQAAN